MASLGMREWIYSPDGTAQVTVSEAELTELISSGQVDGEVLQRLPVIRPIQLITRLTERQIEVFEG